MLEESKRVIIEAETRSLMPDLDLFGAFEQVNIIRDANFLSKVKPVDDELSIARSIGSNPNLIRSRSHLVISL
jgi:hypothetical protein